jgi:dTDP-4-amino-4,6-dideoxygalactose transaminase
MDYASQIANHEKLECLTSSSNITVFHDAAHSFGSFYKNKPIGHQSKMTMMSFDPIKNITCIDGGALIFKDHNFVEPLRQMRMIGMGQRIQESYKNKRDWGYDVELLGYRYHLSNLHASVGLSQLNKFDFIRSQRRLLYSAYYSKLNPLADCITQGPLLPDVVPFIFCIRVPSSCRNDFKSFLLDHGIETGIHWKPGHLFSRYQNCRRGALPITDKIAQEIVSLPFYPDMSIKDIDFITDRIINYFDGS